MGHRRWLPEGHLSRYQKRHFDGTEEDGSPPERRNGTHVLNQLGNRTFILGKNNKMLKEKKRQRGNEEDAIAKCWKKRSVFFKLPYWEHHLLRHNLDVMHIEKNVCDNLLGTLLNIEHKTKDNLKARLDLADWGVRHQLHAVPLETGRSKLPKACFTMSKDEKTRLCNVISEIKTPDGYASNFSKCVKDLKISGRKSPDCHILIEEIFPLALRSCSPSKQVLSIVVELGSFFRSLCLKVLDVTELDKVQERLMLTLCNMERYFLPSFFTVMVHLMVHLVESAKLGGPVHYRWMYPFERYFVRLKSYARNRAYPEGSIAEGYIADECLTFCSRYFEGVQTRFNRPPRIPNIPLSMQEILWNEPKKKKQSATNSANARKQVHYHTGGRKSIARKRKEMMDENSGKEPDRLTLWDATHKRKDGTYANEATKENWLRPIIFLRLVQEV